MRFSGRMSLGGGGGGLCCFFVPMSNEPERAGFSWGCTELHGWVTNLGRLRLVTMVRSVSRMYFSFGCVVGRMYFSFVCVVGRNTISRVIITFFLRYTFTFDVGLLRL